MKKSIGLILILNLFMYLLTIGLKIDMSALSVIVYGVLIGIACSLLFSDNSKNNNTK